MKVKNWTWKNTKVKKSEKKVIISVKVKLIKLREWKIAKS